MNNWIVPYAWSYFVKDGFLQPYFTLTARGKAHLEYCGLLNNTLQLVGTWHRNSMATEVVLDLEARYVKECLPLNIPGVRVPVSPISKKEGR